MAKEGSVAPKERINVTFKPALGDVKEEIELPLKLLVVGDFKVLQREQIGSWKARSDLELELNKWIRQYIADQDNPGAEVRGRRPLRSAQILVSDVDGEPGWYRVAINVRPHFKYMGADFTLSLVGKLDKE